MTIFTECQHCKRVINAELRRDVTLPPGDMKLTAKIVCNECSGITDIFMTALPAEG